MILACRVVRPAPANPLYRSILLRLSHRLNLLGLPGRSVQLGQWLRLSLSRPLRPPVPLVQWVPSVRLSRLRPLHLPALPVQWVPPVRSSRLRPLHLPALLVQWVPPVRSSRLRPLHLLVRSTQFPAQADGW